MADMNLAILDLGMTGTPAFTNFTLNQSTDAAEWIFQTPPEAITITKLGFRYGARAGTPPTFKISLQGVDASGNPDGTIKGGGSPVSKTFTPPADATWNGTWQWITLDNSYAAVAGEKLAIVIAYDSGTIDGSNSSSFTVYHGATLIPGIPYGIQNDNGARTRTAAACCFGYASNTIAYGSPAESVITAAYSSASTPDEKATKFTMPVGSCSTYKIAGVRVSGILAATGEFDVKLYDTDGTTVLQATTFDSDHDQVTANSRSRPFFFDDALAVLNAGSAYRLSFLPTTGSHGVYGVTMDSAGDLEAWPMGSNVVGSTRSDAGAWTDDPLTRYGIWPILDDLTGAASGGGLLIGGNLVL